MMFWQSRNSIQNREPQIAPQLKLPIRNLTQRPIKLFIEVECDEYEIPPGGEAVVILEKDRPHSIDLMDDMIVVWNEGCGFAVVEINVA